MTQDAPQPAGRWQLHRPSPLQWPAMAAFLADLHGAVWVIRREIAARTVVQIFPSECHGPTGWAGFSFSCPPAP